MSIDGPAPKFGDSPTRDERFLLPEDNQAVPCVRCNKPLSGVEGLSKNQPHDAVCFRAYGQYGSTSFDPMDGSFIEINLCDTCVGELALSHIVSFLPNER